MMLFIILLVSQVMMKSLNPKKVIYAMNCGAPSTLRGLNGIVYEKDVQADPDTIVADYNLNSEVASQVIKYTREPDIYMTERHAYKQFGYQLPLQKEGTYTLILKFAEMYFDAKNKRIFHVRLGEQKVIENLDVVAKVGKYAANDEYIEFQYLAGQIFINDTLCVDAVKNGKLQLHLEKTKFDNPYIHGIILYSGPISETDYQDYQLMRKDWDKIQKEERLRQEQEKLKKSEKRIKRKERVKIRNDHLNEIENEFEIEDTQIEKQELSKPQRLSLKQYITGPIGTIGLYISFFVGLKVLDLFVTKVKKYKFKIKSDPFEETKQMSTPSKENPKQQKQPKGDKKKQQ